MHVTANQFLEPIEWINSFHSPSYQGIALICNVGVKSRFLVQHQNLPFMYNLPHSSFLIHLKANSTIMLRLNSTQTGQMNKTVM